HMRAERDVPAARRRAPGERGQDSRAATRASARHMKRSLMIVVLLCVIGAGGVESRKDAFAREPAGSPTIVVETSSGVFTIETYPLEAPKTVAHVVDLVRQGFYDGQRIHRAIPGFIVQWGDPRSRDLDREAEWGRGAAASSGKPIGVAEISRKRQHT